MKTFFKHLYWFLTRRNFKVIGTSNFANESVDDILVKEHLTKWGANTIVRFMNQSTGDYSTYFYQTVPQDHKLYKWEP